MGFMEKLGLVEKVPDESTQGYDAYEDEPTDVAEANLDDVRVDTLISDIYAQNDLTVENGIFKVEELMNNLPKEMTTDIKRQTVHSILSSFGVTVTEVVADGEKRSETLVAVLNNITVEGNERVSEMENNIEELKKSISDLEKKIADEKAEMKSSTEIINAEKERVDNLLKFIGGE